MEFWGMKGMLRTCYSIYQGTAIDTKLILDHLPSYLPASVPKPHIHMVLGISLGGHSAWHCLFNYPEFTVGVVIIGCCDYPALMADRAVKSKLSTCTDAEPLGVSIFGSESFPDSLYSVVQAIRSCKRAKGSSRSSRAIRQVSEESFRRPRVCRYVAERSPGR